MRRWLELSRLLPALLAVPVESCADPASPPVTGSLEVTTSSSGEPPGASYALQVDGSIRTTMATDGRATIGGLAPGTHAVTLMELPPLCTSAAGNSRSVEIAAATTTRLLFEITCDAPGSLRVITSTSGDALDPDGYTVAVNGATGRAIGTSDTVVFEGLSPGNVRVSLAGMAVNCALLAALPSSVHIGSGAQTTLNVAIQCQPSNGAGVIQVVVSASLINAGPIASFTAVLDGVTSLQVPVGGSASFTNVLAGSHSVRLRVPSYCSVGGFTPAPNPVEVVVPANGTATVRFSVLCIG